MVGRFAAARTSCRNKFNLNTLFLVLHHALFRFLVIVKVFGPAVTSATQNASDVEQPKLYLCLVQVTLLCRF